MKTKILITAILLLVNIYSTISQTEAISGDFGLGGTVGTNLKIRISSYSIPFEGITNPKPNYIPFNRINNIQNGVNYRFFTSSNSIVSSNIESLFFEGIVGPSGIVFDLGHVSGAEFPDGGINNAYGFCKYLIEFEIPLTGEKYSLFYNTLDSKFGGKFPNGSEYFIGDVYIKYLDTLPLNKRVKVYREVRSGPNHGFSDIDTISTSDTLPNGLPSKEIKVWDIYYGNNSSPYEKKFYARSTPFPISPLSAQDTNMRRELIIGTKVVFDTVFRNNDDILGGLDKWGYNTENDPYYSYPDIPFNKPGKTYLTPGTYKQYYWPEYHEEYGIKIVAEQNDTMIFNDSIRFWVFGTGQFQNGIMQGDTLVLKEGSTVILGNASEIFTHNGGVLIDEGANRVWGNESCHRAFPNTAINFTGESHTVNNGGFIVIDEDANLNIGNNTTLTFDGNNSFLKLSPNSKVNLGANSKIEFKNSAYLIADSCDFKGNNGAIWDGLVFHNAGGQMKIENCTFNDAKKPIEIINTSTCSANLDKKIISNEFNLPATGTKCIYAENVFKLLLHGNTFNIAPGKTGVEISNSINAGSSQEEGGESSGGSLCLSTTYALNILGNTFSNGANQLLMNCNASAVTPFWVHGNHFSSTGSTVISLFGRKITGDIKSNTFTSNNLGNNVILVQSSVNVFNNVMNAANRNFVLATQSTLKMSPLFINNQIVWTAGRNNAVSQTDNIHIVATNHYLPILDKGRNCFTVPTGTNKFHIIGNNINWPNSPYMIRENSWSPNNIPVIHLLDLGGLPINYIYSPTVTCNTPSWDGYTVEDMGFGIFDTTFYTSGYAGSPDPEIDEAMYYQAMDSYNANDYLTSINNFKYLIQNYPESDYTEACLYDLYDCYRSLDTSSDETYTDNLYSDLKNFLSGIILDETHSGPFEETAYEIILICDASMGKYNDALTGYEFISMYHPDPEVRFLASADYAEIMAIMGSGQSESGMTEIEKLNRLERKLINYVRNDPVANKLNVKFEQEMNKKVVESSREMSSREIDNMSRKEKEEKVFKGNDRELVSKSTTLLMNSRVMNSDERKKFIMEGIFMIAGLTPAGDDLTENPITPSSYDLTQNYPNPFNPVTNISFSIPVEGLVKLKVFDITGREVAVLVNELKTPGSYNVSFNGSTLSSGVYFYRIEAGSFVETKRMLLIK